MEVHLAPDVEKRLNDLALRTGRPADEILKDALAGYWDELTQTRDILNRRYDDLKSGRVKPIDGEEALARLQDASFFNPVSPRVRQFFNPVSSRRCELNRALIARKLRRRFQRHELR